MKQTNGSGDCVDLQKYWARKQDVSVCLYRDGAILYDPDTGFEKPVNQTGLAVWSAMDGVSRIPDIAEHLATNFETPETESLQADIGLFADELLERRLANASDHPSRNPMPSEEYSDFNESPRSFDLSLTGRCNLRCEYCFYADEMIGRRDLSSRNWMEFFNELKTLAVRHLTLSGGEIFIREDLWELIDGIIDSRMRYSILSNGTLITETTVEQFCRKDRKRRLDSVQISIDGSCPEIHDRSRGRGCFAKAVRGLILLKDAGIPVVVRVTVNRHNVNDLENTARFLIDDLGLDGFSTNDAMPMGAGCSHQESITLTPEQRLVAMKTLVMLERRYPGRISALAGALAEWRMYNEMEQSRKTGIRTTRWRMGTLSSCGCMFSKLAVHHDGVIAPCNMLANASLGVIGRDAIRDIWTNHPILKEMRQRATIPMTEVPGCKGCEWLPYCNGGCPGVEFTRTGQMNVANPDTCYRRFIETTGGLPDIGEEN